MRRRRITAILGAAVLAATGTGAAIGATSSDEAKKTEQEVLADAAKRLDTSPEKLRDALGAALDAQLDQAVKDGELTQEQADAIKQRRQQSGRVLGIGPGGPGMHHGFRGGPGGPRGGGIMLDDVAKALGISVDELHTQLRDGKTLAQIAKAEGKSLADVKASVKAAAKKRLDAAVASGDITQKQADAKLEHLDEHLDRLGTARMGGPRFRGRGPGGPGGGPIEADVAKALGISVGELFTRLRDGKTLAQIAKAEGKTVAQVKSAAKAAAKKRLDAAVARDDLTRKQADAMLEHLDEHLDRLGTGRFGPRGHGPGPGGPPPGIGPGMEPGNAPAPAPESGTVDA